MTGQLRGELEHAWAGVRDLDGRAAQLSVPVRRAGGFIASADVGKMGVLVVSKEYFGASNSSHQLKFIGNKATSPHLFQSNSCVLA